MKIIQVEAVPFAIPYVKPLRISDGELPAGQRPGIGVEVDPAKLARYRTDR